MAELRRAPVRGVWSTEEDEALKAAVRAHGVKSWAVVSTHIKGRSGKQCRERWSASIDPDLRPFEWTAKEDAKLAEAHAKYGGRWGKIARVLPGRSEVAARQRWDMVSKSSQHQQKEELKLEETHAPAGKRERSPAATIDLMPSPRPATSFFQELASPHIRGDAATDAILASPTKRHRNALLVAEECGAAGPADDEDKLALCRNDAYDLMPRQSVWKSVEVGVEKGGSEATAVSGIGKEPEKRLGTGGECTGATLGAGLGMFARTSAQRKEEERRRREEGAAARRAQAKAAQLEAAKEAAARRLAERKASGIGCRMVGAHSGGGSHHHGAGVPLSLAYSGQPTTFCPDDDEFLYRKRSSGVSLNSVLRSTAEECDAKSLNPKLHVVGALGGVSLGGSGILRQGAGVRGSIANRENSPPSIASTATTAGADPGERRQRGAEAEQSRVAAPPFPLHSTQKGTLHRDLLYRLFYLDKQNQARSLR